MSPYTKAFHQYLSYGGKPAQFYDLVKAHLITGTVISNDEVFILFRPVETTFTNPQLNDPLFKSSSPNAYHVYLMAGDLSKIEKHLPPALEFITYHRDGSDVIHKVSFAQFIRLISRARE